MNANELRTTKPERRLPPRPRKKVEVEIVPLTPEQEAESRRRKGVAELASKTAGLDRELFTSFQLGEVSIERIEAWESLISGKELNREELAKEEPEEGTGKAVQGVNAITRRTYEGDPPRVAYVKPQSGEVSYGIDDNTGRVAKFTRFMDEETQMLSFRAVEDPTLEEMEKESIENELQQRQETLSSVARLYGVTPEEVPLSPHELTKRLGVDAGKAAIREYMASRINELVHFGVVPLTVLRAEKDNSDVSSVQEEAKVTDKKMPPRVLTDEEFVELIQKGPEHPGSKSFMRMACLDYLIQGTDRHLRNFLYDPAGKEFSMIDNGYSFGLSQAVELPAARGKEKQTVATPLDRGANFPLQIVGGHSEWKLDEEAMAQLKRLYEDTKEYLQLREAPLNVEQPSERKGKGQGIKYLTKLFRTLWGNEKIAAKEALALMSRIRDLIDQGRPPETHDLMMQGFLNPHPVIERMLKAPRSKKAQPEQEEVPSKQTRKVG